MEIDLEKLKLSQEFNLDIGVKKELIAVPVRKPDKQWFIQVHPDNSYNTSVAVIELKDDRETYVVDPLLWDELRSELIPKKLLCCINMQGNVFLWPIRLPGQDGKIDDWNRSALEAADHAVGSWCRVISNMSLGSYEILKAMSPGPSPKWTEKNFPEIFKIAFKDKIITSTDHPVVKKLKGIL